MQSIPAVYALRDGQLLDSFVGLLPEPQIRAWIDRLLPTPAEQLVAEARALAATDAKSAEAKLKEAAALDANLETARIALAELLVGEQRIDEARAVIEELEVRGFLEPEAEKVKAQLHLASQAGKADEVEALRAAAAANPKDLQARLELAKGLAAAHKNEEALQTALSVVQAGNKQYVEPARELMVDLFRLLEGQDELVTEYRRKLSTALDQRDRRSGGSTWTPACAGPLIRRRRKSDVWSSADRAVGAQSPCFSRRRALVRRTSWARSNTSSHSCTTAAISPSSGGTSPVGQDGPS